MASSQTSSNQTYSSVQWPSQWTPSAWFLPMMAFFRVEPASRRKTASALPVCLCQSQEVVIAERRRDVWGERIRRREVERTLRFGAGNEARRTSFRLTATGASAAVIASPFTVVGSTGFDGNHFAVCLCGSGFRDTASVAVAGECDGQDSRKEELDTGYHNE